MLLTFLSTITTEQEKVKLEQLYLSYRNQMLYLAKSMLKSHFDAEDVVHTVFTVVARNMDMVQNIPHMDLKNYLLKATKNTAINSLKQRNSRDQMLDIDSLPAITDGALIEEYCYEENIDAIVKHIKALDEKYRDVLYYRFVMEMEPSEIAVLLQRKLSTVKQQLVRGKKMLVNALENDEEETI